jgi:hypothetical protein
MAVLHQVRENVDFDILGHRIDAWIQDDVFEMLAELFVLPLNGHIEEDLA